MLPCNGDKNKIKTPSDSPRVSQAFGGLGVFSFMLSGAQTMIKFTINQRLFIRRHFKNVFPHLRTGKFRPRLNSKKCFLFAFRGVKK